MDTKGRFQIKHHANEDFFNTMSHELAWVVGLLAADGHIEKSGKRLSISQSGACGREMITVLSTIIGYDGPIEVRDTIGQAAYSLRFTSQMICEELAKFGITNNKTKTFSMPNIPKEYLSSFVRGYIDGDGSVGVYKVGGSQKFYIVSVVGNDWLMKDFATLVPAKNCVFTKKSSITEARWNGQNAYLASKWIYQSYQLPHTKKYKIWKEYENGIAEDHPRWYSKYLLDV